MLRDRDRRPEPGVERMAPQGRPPHLQVRGGVLYPGNTGARQSALKPRGKTPTRSWDVTARARLWYRPRQMKPAEVCPGAFWA